MLKIKNLIKDSYTLTGSSVLKLIMDQGIPEIDLLVRESLQNSLDAVKDEFDFAKVNFLTGSFISKKLANQLEGINEKMNLLFTNESYNYLAIQDVNTKGLLGSHLYSNDKTKAHNLYSLVYDIMNTNKGPKSGGSWGIGKSVYYRFGNGLCFFYSRTFEDGVYKSKLAGSLIEREDKDNRLSVNDTGIAFFGDLDINGKAKPIYDEIEINAFLGIFGINPFEKNETGTIVIIPYIDYNKMLSSQINQDGFWSKKIENAIDIAVQRWYFSRLNNPKFKNGKYLIAFVNNSKIDLNHFFGLMQKIYNGEDDNATKIVIEQRLFEQPLGTLYYRKFFKNDLMPPYGPFISPYLYFDVEYEEGVNKGIVFYMREPGMALSYNSSEFNTIITNKDEFFIAMFILNDDCSFGKEKLGEYFRRTEQASHVNWANITFEDFPSFSIKKPYTKMVKAINNEFDKLFGKNVDFIEESSSTVLQKKLGKLLLPPEDFGNGASVKPDPDNPKKKKQRLAKQNIKFSGFENGNMVFKVNLRMKPSDIVRFYASISAGGKYSFDEWYTMGFDIPVKFIDFRIDNIFNGKKIPLNITVPFDNMTPKTFKYNGAKLISFSPSINKSGNVYGVALKNSSDADIECQYTLYIKPLDLTYSIIVDTEWNYKKAGDNK